ncbi:MAG: tetratricopeptide repeat protein, partial [Planctomycetota bacterium]
MRSVALLLTLILGASSCATGPPGVREKLHASRKLVKTQPQEALRRLAPILEAHPKNVEARSLQAQAYERLGNLKEAAVVWEFILELQVEKRPKQRLHAHRGLARVNEKILGDLPHRVTGFPQGELRTRVMATLESWNRILENYPKDREA